MDVSLSIFQAAPMIHRGAFFPSPRLFTFISSSGGGQAHLRAG